MTDVSIIIVNYHSADLVIDCVNSIFAKTEGIIFEVIIVDNASGDGSAEKIHDVFGEQVKVVKSSENLGFGKANNLGNTYANGEYLFFLNPDTILVNNAIKILWASLQENPEYGVVGGNLYMPDMNPAPSYCLKFDDLEAEKKSASWNYLISSKLKQKLAIRKGIPFQNEFNRTGSPMKVAYIFGADIMMKKSIFDEVNGFDPDFFMYAEEEELTWRITQRGYQVMNIPDAKIIHLEGATSKKQNEFSERQFRMRMNGAMTYYRKRFGIEGVHSFYKYRTLRYMRLIQIARLQHKLTNNFLPIIQKRCLEEEYANYIEKL